LGIALVHYCFGPVMFHGVRVTDWLAAATCFYAIARNFLDFSRHYALLKPRAI
jgi:hypothetical protein